VKLAFKCTQLLDFFEQLTSIPPCLLMLPGKILTAIPENLLPASPARSYAGDGALLPRICFSCLRCGNRLAITKSDREIRAGWFGVVHAHTPAAEPTSRFV
jgi:hypothetical protein